MKVIVSGVETDLGAVEVNPTISIHDFSRRETDDFGATTVVKRGFSRRLSARIVLPTNTVDAVRAKLVEVKDAAAIWVAHPTLEWLQPEGYYKDFEIDIAAPTVSYCTLSVEGLAETEVIADGGEDPAPSGQVSTLTLQPDGGAAVGLGVTEVSPTAGINNFSRKVVDDFGGVTIVPRGWSERMTVQAYIRTDAVDIVANRIAAVRATPVTWTGQSGIDTLTITGFWKDFSIEVGENISKLTISVEGLTTAVPTVPLEDLFKGITTDRFPDLLAPPLEPKIGSLWFDANHKPYRFEGREIHSGDVPLTVGGVQLLCSGWVSVRDTGLETVINDLQALDDDGKLTVIEKQIAIERDRWLLNHHNGIMQQAGALGYDATAVVDARASYVALRDSLSPPWNDLSQETNFSGVAWDATLDAYEEALEEASADMTALAGVTVTPPGAQIVQLESNGAPAAGQFPRTLTPTVSRGAQDIRTNDEVTYSIATTGDIAATIDSTNGSADKGRITVTGGKDGTIELTVAVSGVAMPAVTIPFTSTQKTEFAENASGYAILQRANDRVFCNQWGRITVGANATGTITFPFPMKTDAGAALPTCVVNGGPASTTDSANLRVIAVTGTGATVINNDGSSNLGFWTAMGELA